MYFQRLEGLHDCVGKHCDPKVVEIFTTVENLKFGKRPFDHIKPKDQIFQTWIKDENGNHFQGEVELNGLKDGIGILVFAGSGLWIAHFKANIRHGPFWSIKKNGKIYSGNFLDGVKQGTFLVSDSQGTKKVVYEKGKLIP